MLPSPLLPSPYTLVHGHAHCRKCGRKGSVAAVRVNTLAAGRLVESANLNAWRWVWDNRGQSRPLVAFCSRCTEPVAAAPMVTKVTKHKCGARCTSSTGHVCECSCGGENHGAGI